MRAICFFLPRPQVELQFNPDFNAPTPFRSPARYGCIGFFELVTPATRIDRPAVTRNVGRLNLGYRIGPLGLRINPNPRGHSLSMRFRFPDLNPSQ